MDKFNELLLQYNKVAEDVTFEVEGLSDEELEAKFNEVFGAESSSETETETENESEDTVEEGVETEVETEPEEDGAKFSITVGDEVKEFSLSLGEKQEILWTLVNAQYGDADNAYYGVEVFDDDGYIIMQDWCSGKAFKQNYLRENDEFQLVGDRVPVMSVWVTESERDELDNMRNRFADISDRLQKYEEEPQKMEILNSEDYASLTSNEAFASLKDVNAHFDMSVEDVRAKADEILLNAAKAGNVNFREQPETTTFKKFPISAKKGTGRYGKLFSR